MFFLALGESQNGVGKRTVYEHKRVAVCSHKRALLIAAVVLSLLLIVSLIIAYAGPQAGNFSSLTLSFFKAPCRSYVRCGNFFKCYL